MKNTFTYLLLSFLLILISKSYTQSQQFIIQKYSVENGLPDNRVNDIAQDSLGRIWIAMKTGIAMYDGVNWKKFGKKDGVPEIEYVKIKIDEKGTIWFLPFWMGNKFIVFFKESNWGRINIEINDTRTRIFRSVDVMYKSGKPVIWIITRVSGLLKFEDNKWERISQKNGLVSDKLFSILLSYGKVYVGSDKGFSIIQDTLIKNYFVKGKDPRILGIAESMDSDSTEKIIFLGENWLGEYSNEKINFLSVNFNIPIIGVDDMIVLKAHSNGDIFFGNTTSIFAYNLIDKQIHQIFFSEPSSNEGVNSLLVDYERNIWFAGNRGIYKFIYSPFKNYYKSNGLLENEVSAISQFNDGDIVFGHNYGLTIKKDDKFIKITTSHNNLYSELVRILDMYHDKKVDKIFFAGYTNGIGVLANNDFLKWIKENNSTRYFSIFSNSKNQIFVTTDRGLIEMSYTKVLKVFPAVHQYARKGIFVGDSVIYLATNEGLVKFNFIKLTLIKNPITDANNLFNLFYNKKYGLLAGSIKGLYTLKNDELVKYKLNDQEIDESVYFIIEDKNNNLWIGTNNGVLKWDGKEIRRYNKSDGLAGNETNRAAGFVDSKGNVWIGTDGGVSMYTGKELDYSKIKPKLILSDVESGSNIKHTLTSISSFDPDDNNLTFNYRGLSFIDESRNLYQVRLSKLNSEFCDSLITNYTYYKFNNLSSGDYIFSVRFKNAKEIWSDWHKSSVITIKQHFYNSPFFIIAAIVVFSLFLFYIYEFINQSRYSKKLRRIVDDQTKSLKKKQAELVTSLERYKGIVDSQTDMVVRVDSENRFTYVNDTYCNVFGKQQNELLGKTFYPLVHPDDIENSLDEMKKLAYPPHRAKMEQRALTVNGYRWMSWEDYAICDAHGKIIEIQGVGRDITIQKEIEAELEKRVKERTTELKSLVSQSPLGILTFNEEGYLIDYNDAANFLFKNLDEYLYPILQFNIYDDEFLIRNNYKERLNNLHNTRGLLITNRILIDNAFNDIYKNLLNKYLLYRIYTVEYEDRSKNLVLLLEDVTELQKTEDVNKKLTEEKIRISTFIKTIEKERERISKELHDGIGQLLTSAKLKLDAFRMKTTVDKTEVDDALNILLNAGDEIRRIINDLRPYDVDNFGLISAIELLCDRIRQGSGLNVQYSVNNYKEIENKNRENIAYRIVQEALNNIVKHSNCLNAGVNIIGNENNLILEIWDDGIGMNLNEIENNHKGFGIPNMKGRVTELGGEISFTPRTPKGLLVKLEIPIKQK